MEEGNTIKRVEIPKNKWLHTNDDFGKLEEDMVFEYKTFKSGKGENRTETEGFTIIEIQDIVKY